VTLRDADASLDPDALAELEREREFLLRSLDDLDAEYHAGDMDEVDYAGLNDDYTRRLAEVARSIESEQTAFAQLDNKLSGKQRTVTIIAITAVAIVAGLLLARASGFRSPADSVTGDIRQSSTGLLAEADTLTREGEWPEAIEVYNEVLDVSPGNAEALTYRGWLTARLGDNESGLLDLVEAVQVDPELPDARVFAAIVYDDLQQFEQAAEQLAVLDTLDTPDEMLGLIQASNLRASITAGQIKQKFDPIEPGDVVDLSQVVGTLDDVALGGALLSQLDDLLLSQATFDAVLAQDPEQVVALVGKGQLARRPGIVEASPEIAADSLQKLDDAVRLAPDVPVIRLYRADARAIQQDLDGARTDLLAVDRDELSPDLQLVYDELEASLSGG